MTTATLLQHSVISSRSSTAGNGTGHGADTIQVTRTSGDVLYSTWLDDTPQPWPDNSQPLDFWRHTHLMRSLDQGASWVEIDNFVSGQESGYAFYQGGSIKVICYPDGLPSVYDMLTHTVTAIPGNWQTRVGNNAQEINGWWYGACGMGSDGVIYMARAKVNAQDPLNKPCVFQCQSLRPDGTYGGFWETQPLADGRFGYGNIFPQSDGTFLMAAMLAITGAEAGYAAEAFVWTDPALLKFDPGTKTVTVLSYLYHGTPMPNGGAPHITVNDALQLPGGDILVSYAGYDGAHPNWFSAVARVTPSGVVLWTSLIPFAYGNEVRMTQLTDGSVALGNVFPDHPNGPTTPAFAYAFLDPGTGVMSAPSYLAIPASIPLDWSAGTQNMFSLTKRGGSFIPPNTLVLKFSMGPGATEHYFAFLFVLDTPTPPPTPVPDNTQAILDLQAGVAALQHDLDTLRATVGSIDDVVASHNALIAGFANRFALLRSALS